MEHDDKLMTVDEYAVHYDFPPAYVRLLIDAGYPTQNGKVVPAELSLWLLDNYAVVRATAGLPPLPGEEGLDSTAAARVRVANGLITLSDYLGSRSSCSAVKQEANEVSSLISGYLDRDRVN